MKNEQVLEALHKAFREFWDANESISISGRPTAKDAKYNYLVFDDNNIQLLMHGLGCNIELPTIKGSLEAYVPAENPQDKKSIRLTFTMSNRQYIALYDRDFDEVSIKFKEIIFH